MTCAKVSHLCHQILRAGRHHPDLCANLYRAFHDSAEYDNTFIGIVNCIKNECLKRCVRISRRCRNLCDNLLQNLINIKSGLGGYSRRIRCLYTDHILNLFNYLIRSRTGQINLVDDRHDIQVMIQRQIDIGQSLSLHALSRIHYQNGSVTGRKTPGHLIIKIHMSGRVNQIENVLFSVLRFVYNADRLGFDRDSTLSLQIHIIQYLSLHFPAGQCPCPLYNTIRKC